MKITPEKKQEMRALCQEFAQHAADEMAVALIELNDPQLSFMYGLSGITGMLRSMSQYINVASGEAVTVERAQEIILAGLTGMTASKDSTENTLQKMNEMVAGNDKMMFVNGDVDPSSLN